MKRMVVLLGIAVIAAGMIIGVRESIRLLAANEDISEDHIAEGVYSSNENNDLFLLASLIESEASGKSYAEQVAVGAVVLNRRDSPLYPDTLASVIYQRGGFQSVNNGFLDVPRQSSLNAAKDALRGWDPTYGALEISDEGR